MAKVRQRVRAKRRVSKAGSGYKQCNMCGGTGRIKVKK